MQTNLNRRLAVTGALKLAAMVIGLGILAPPSSHAADNPYNLIDPAVISVGTMGDAKPYVFTDADGNFTGFDAELFRDVARRMGLPIERLVIGSNVNDILPRTVATGVYEKRGVTPTTSPSSVWKRTMMIALSSPWVRSAWTNVPISA